MRRLRLAWCLPNDSSCLVAMLTWPQSGICVTPCLQALTLRAAAWPPTDPFEKAMLLVERSKDTRNPAVRADYLRKTLSELQTVPAAQPPKASGEQGRQHGRHHRGLDRVLASCLGWQACWQRAC